MQRGDVLCRRFAAVFPKLVLRCKFASEFLPNKTYRNHKI